MCYRSYHVRSKYTNGGLITYFHRNITQLPIGFLVWQWTVHSFWEHSEFGCSLCFRVGQLSCTAVKMIYTPGGTCFLLLLVAVMVMTSHQRAPAGKKDSSRTWFISEVGLSSAIGYCASRTMLAFFFQFEILTFHCTCFETCSVFVKSLQNSVFDWMVTGARFSKEGDWIELFAGIRWLGCYRKLTSHTIVETVLHVIQSREIETTRL